jgi:predicted porin
MKKHLIAAAVAGALAVPAMAQVKVYGAFDMNVTNVDNGTVKTTVISDGVLATNRIGVSGGEDLGGGLKANFQMQGSFTPQADATQTFSFNEELWVGLSGGFGSIRIGRTDVTGLQALDSTVGQSGNAFNSSTIAGEQRSDQGNVIRYITPSIAGFSADVAFEMPSTKGASTKDSNEATTAVFLSYKAGPLGVYGGQAKTDKIAGAADVTKLAYEAFGATYDLGMAKVGLLVSKADASTSSNDKDNKQTILSVVVPVGNGLSIHGGYLKGETGTANADVTGMTVAVVKALSKRTSIYGGYTSVNNDPAGTARWGLVNAGAAPAAGEDPKAYAIGVSHSF